MDVEFDDILLHWRNQFDAPSDVNLKFPVEHSTVEIFLDDFPELKEDTVDFTCPGSNPVNVVPNLPSWAEDIVLFLPRTNSAKSMPSPIWSASDGPTYAATGSAPLMPDWINSPCDVLQPTLINSSPGSVTTTVSISQLCGQRGSCVTEENSRPAKRKELGAARVSLKKIKINDIPKPVKQSRPKATQLPSPEEHILRERKRRDDMAAKFLALEKCLPLGAKREKAVIVEDAINLVKNLKLRKQELLKCRAQMKLKLLNRNIFEASPQYPSSQSKRYPSCEKLAGDMQFGASLKLQPMQVTTSSILDRRKPVDPGGPTFTEHSQNDPIAGATIEDMTPLKIDTNSCCELLQIHAQVSNEEILVEMLFHRYSPNLHTRVMQTVEFMKLEVIRGSMQRSVPCGFIECIITTKHRVECQSRRQDTQSSARLLVGALQAAFSRSGHRLMDTEECRARASDTNSIFCGIWPPVLLLSAPFRHECAHLRGIQSDIDSKDILFSSAPTVATWHDSILRRPIGTLTKVVSFLGK